MSVVDNSPATVSASPSRRSPAAEPGVPAPARRPGGAGLSVTQRRVIVDTIVARREPAPPPLTNAKPLGMRGFINLLLIGTIIASILGSAIWQPKWGSVHWPLRLPQVRSPPVGPGRVEVGSAVPIRPPSASPASPSRS